VIRVCAACGSAVCLDGDWICGDPEKVGAWCSCDWGDEAQGLLPLATDPNCEVHRW